MYNYSRSFESNKNMMCSYKIQGVTLSVFVKSSLLVLLMVAQILSLLFTSYHIEAGIRIANIIFFGSGLFLFVFNLFTNKKINQMRFFCPFVFVFVLLLSWLLQGFTHESFISFLGFFIIATSWIVSDSSFSDRLFKLFVASVIIQGLILSALYFSDRAYVSYTLWGGKSELLTLGLNNSNQAGISLFGIICLLLSILAVWKKHIAIKTIIIAEIAFLTFLLYKTGCRTCLVALIFVLLCFLISKWYKVRSTTFINTLVGILLVSIILFVFLYISLANNPLFADITIFGKKIISGRQRVYLNSLSYWTNPFIGNIQHFNFSNDHNGLLTIMMNLGIIGLLFYLFYVFAEFYLLIQKMHSIKKFIPIFGVIVGFFIIAFGESSVVVDGTNYYFYFLFTLIMFHKYHDNYKNKLFTK